MQLLVLAGGFGSRLKSVVSSVPKPLAPVNNRPFLAFQMQNWISQGITDFIFLLHYEANQIIEFFNHFNGLKKQGISIQYIVEEKPLGTGGSIANAVRTFNLTSNFFVANADTWLDVNFKLLGQCPAPSIAITQVRNASRYGSVIIREDKFVEKFIEKADQDIQGFINTGISYLNPEIFSSWKGQVCSLETEYFPSLALRGDLYSICLNENFIDIGIPEDYHRFCEWVKNGQKTKL